jgi:hypothetical protein
MSADNMIAIVETQNNEFRIGNVFMPQLEDGERIYNAFKNSEIINNKNEAYLIADKIASSIGWETIEYGIQYFDFSKYEFNELKFKSEYELI